MKTIENRTDHELKFTDPRFFVEACLTSKEVAEGTINESTGEFTGKIFVNRLAGDVQRYMSAKVMGALELAADKEPSGYVSRFKINDPCSVLFCQGASILNCKVKSVRFTQGKVKYDILVIIEEGKGEVQGKATVIKNVDSAFVVEQGAI